MRLQFFFFTHGDRTDSNLNQGDCDNGDDVNTAEKVPIDDMANVCDGLIEGREQCSFIIEKEIMSVYKLRALSQVQWLTPVILALWEAEVGGSPEVRSLRPAWPTC